ACGSLYTRKLNKYENEPRTESLFGTFAGWRRRTPPHPSPLPLGGGDGESQPVRGFPPLPRRGGEGWGEGASAIAAETRFVGRGASHVQPGRRFCSRRKHKRNPRHYSPRYNSSRRSHSSRLHWLELRSRPAPPRPERPALFPPGQRPLARFVSYSR